MIPWSGGLFWWDRSRLAKNIVKYMKQHHFKDGEGNYAVSHSHGSNGFMQALPTLKNDGIFVNAIVTLGQPMRSDYPFTSGAGVGKWFNIYAHNDLWQRLGGEIPLLGGRTNPAAINDAVDTHHGFLTAHSALHNDKAVRALWMSFIRTHLNDPFSPPEPPKSVPPSQGAPPAAKGPALNNLIP